MLFSVAGRSLASGLLLEPLDLGEQQFNLGAGITVSHLSKIETGKVNPTWGTVEGIAKALNVTMIDMAKRATRAQR